MYCFGGLGFREALDSQTPSAADSLGVGCLWCFLCLQISSDREGCYPQANFATPEACFRHVYLSPRRNPKAYLEVQGQL